jgi:fatty-acyl-CoA synthase
MPSADRWQPPSTRTFSELLTDVHKAANMFRQKGIRRHSPVAIISPNCDELITATLAAQLAGIAAPINGGLSGEHISHLVERSGARVLIAAAPELDEASWQVARHLVGARVIDTVLLLRPTGDRAAGAPVPAIEGATVRYFSDFPRDDDGSFFDGEAPSANDLAALFHTGGTTGKPKPAAHTHANEVTDAWMIAANTLLDQDSVLFAGLPLFHVNALVVTLLAPLLRGQQAVWAGPLGYRDMALYANFWKIVQHYGISASPAMSTSSTPLTFSAATAPTASCVPRSAPRWKICGSSSAGWWPT